MTARPELEITPEPTPEQRAAIEAAVGAAFDSKKEAAAPMWWRAGILEATEDSDGAY